MKHTELAGVVVPAITPVDDEDRVDEAAFRKGLRRLISAGVHAIFVGGSAGEGPLLTAYEWERMVSIARDEVGSDVHLLGGAIDTSTKRVEKKLAILSRLGIRTASSRPRTTSRCVTPTRPTAVRRVRGGSAGHTDRGVQHPIVCRLNHPGRSPDRGCAAGLLPISQGKLGDFDYFQRLVIEGRDVGLKVLEGEEPHIARGMLAGAVGIVPVCANFEPATYIAAYRAGLARDEAALVGLQERILELRRELLLVGPLWIAGIKYAMSLLGVGSANRFRRCSR